MIERNAGLCTLVTPIRTVGALLGMLFLPLHVAAATETIVPPAEVAQSIVINDVRVQTASVSGTLVNQSFATLRRVELLVRQVWLWDDEVQPGPDSQGRTLIFTLPADVAPNASIPFTFDTPPLTQRPDGRFVTTIDVGSFIEVGLQRDGVGSRSEDAGL